MTVVIERALDIMPRLTCGQAPCEATTPDERANPPISGAEARAVYDRGVLSGRAERCRLDWQNRNFLAMMTYWRLQRGKSPRQMAMIGAIHGMGQDAGYEDTPTCTGDVRRAVDADLDFHS